MDTTTRKVAMAAQQYQAEERRAGREVSATDAVSHILAQQAGR